MIRFGTGDTLEMKKSHPCGGKFFLVIFAGSDVKVRCTTCGREVLLPRIKLEKNVKNVICGAKND